MLSNNTTVIHLAYTLNLCNLDCGVKGMPVQSLNYNLRYIETIRDAQDHRGCSVINIDSNL